MTGLQTHMQLVGKQFSQAGMMTVQPKIYTCVNLQVPKEAGADLFCLSKPG